MRRRVEGDFEDSRRFRKPRVESYGFRVLEDTNISDYYLGIPEPPRAPEPYKITGGSSSTARAHRRSSFVILADSGESISRSVAGSPAHERIRSPLSPHRVIHGRSSPFRPRGFKGPPPHAQSRPQSPPVPAQRRFIQPKSLSQGNSPRKQSLIPQPQRGFISRTKSQKNKDRDRWERRSGRYVTRIPRSSSLKAPTTTRRPVLETTRAAKLSNKPTKPTPNSTTNLNSFTTTTNTTLPITTITNAQAQSEKKINRSPTKIPIRHTPSGRFIQLPNSEKPERIIKENLPPATESNSASSNQVNDQAAAVEVESNSTQPEVANKDLGIADLLKQPAAGDGTASVVNATTTTAVQPLKIDAAKILPLDIDSISVKNSKEDKKNSSRSCSPEIQSSNASTSQKISAIVKDEKTPQSSSSTDVVVEPMNVEAVVENIDKEESKDNTEIITADKEIKKEGRKEGKDGKDTSELIELKENKTKEDEAEKKSKSIQEVEKPQAASSTGSNVFLMNPANEKSESQMKTTIESPEIQAQDKLKNHGSENSIKSSNGLSTYSGESIRSTDTGVSLNTVRGVSSAREKRGTHVVKRSQEIETLSGNVMNLENQRNGDSAIVEVAESTEEILPASSRQPISKRERFKRWKDSVVQRWRDRWGKQKMMKKNKSVMRFPNMRRKKKNKVEKMKKTENENPNEQQQQQQQQATENVTPKPNACSRMRAACLRSVRWHSKIAPAESTTSCCRPERSCCLLCKSSWSWCRWPSCCSCRRGSEPTKNVRAKHSLTSVAPPPPLSEEHKSKIPDVLIEHNSVMRAAIPCLPVPLAWFCLVWNILLPGTGTLWSGLFNLCFGQPRFAATASAKSRFGALIVNIIVGISQLFTVLFCLVGWGWSIWWGVTMIRLARKWKRFKATEASNNDPEARGDERTVLPAPGVPTQALREMERTR
ncbi:protein stum [Chelonus insularis]|uniref:protein stum n=1 Tax=Chelonus insularis TaxID=460826 RepID=UPI00158D0EA3|nr:protein stum [Chelonus insularis]